MIKVLQCFKMDNNHKTHLKTRKSPPFNLLSKAQEGAAVVASNTVWDEILVKYPECDFNNLTTLGLKDLDANFALAYLNRGLKLKSLPERARNDLQAVENASGIRPDGGIFFVKSKIDGFDHIIASLEVKHQGEYDGYTPLSNADWKKKGGDESILLADRPPQAQGNAIERFAKNANAIKTLTSFYGYNPYIVFCEGFDFFLKDDFKIFEHQAYANRYAGKDSSILMRLIAGNEWMLLNRLYVSCVDHGDTKIWPSTIFARMPKWEAKDIVEVTLNVIDRSLAHLRTIGEI